MVRSGAVGVLLFSMLCALAVPAQADYPDRPVTAIVGFPAGGLADVVLRAVAEGMKKKFPKGLAVVNRSGAGGTIGASEIVTSKPDGNTFGIVAVANLVIQPQLTDLPYRTPDDYVPFIGLVSWSPLLAVRQDAPWKTVQEFVTAARANPGKRRVASPGEGTGSHLMLEELMHLANMKVTHVPFSGWAEGSPALLGGHVEAIVAQPGEVRPLVDAKKIRLLGVFQPARNAVFPDVPTFKELGYNASTRFIFLLVAPKGTPDKVVRYLHDAAKAAIEDSPFVSFARARVIDVDYRPADRLRADLWDEYKTHTEILKRIGMLKK